MSEIIHAILVLLILSLITEKVANFIKMQYSSLSLKSKNSLSEKEREKKIQKLTIVIGVVIALIAKANLFLVFNDEFELFWTKKGENETIISNIIGSILTGLFLSLGSKFFHDLLDMLLQVKNLKRKLNDKADWEFDTIDEVNTYLEKNEKVELKTFLNDSFKSFKSYHYYEVDYDNEIISVYTNELTDDLPNIIPYKSLAGKTKFFKVNLIREDEKIKTLSIELNPTDEIANRINPYKTRGSVTYPVKRISDGKEFIMTCYHAVWTHGCDWSVYIPNEDIKYVVHPINGQVIGNIVTAIKNGYFDIALIDPDSNVSLGNNIPYLTSPEGSRKVTDRDVSIQTEVRTWSIQKPQNSSEGYIQNIGIDLNNIDYPDGSQMDLSNLIKIKSYNNSAFAVPGDSGSIVVDEWNYAIGIVVAGNSNTTFAMPIDIILQSFNLKL